MSKTKRPFSSFLIISLASADCEEAILELLFLRTPQDHVKFKQGREISNPKSEQLMK